MQTIIRALLVEDETDIRFIVELSLKRSDRFEVTSFATGLAALEALDGTTNQYDIALVNLNLPFMDGWDFLKRLNQLPTYEAVPAIFITASPQDANLRSSLGANVLGIISKPFEAPSLSNVILNLLRTVV